VWSKVGISTSCNLHILWSSYILDNWTRDWLKLGFGFSYGAKTGYSFLLPLSLRIFLNWSLFSLLAVLDPRLLSPYPDHLLSHHSKLQTVLINIQHPAFGINSLTLSVSLIHNLVFHLLTTLHKSDPYCHHHLYHHQSLLLFFTLDLKRISSLSLFHRRLHHRYTGLISRTLGWTVFLSLIGFVLVFSSQLSAVD